MSTFSSNAHCITLIPLHEKLLSLIKLRPIFPDVHPLSPTQLKESEELLRPMHASLGAPLQSFRKDLRMGGEGGLEGMVTGQVLSL